MLGKMLSPKKPLQLTWEEFLTHIKKKLCSAKRMLELENQFLALKKGIMSVDEYTTTVTDKMDLALRVVPGELTKIDRYAKGFLWQYTVPIKQAPTFQCDNWKNFVTDHR